MKRWMLLPLLLASCVRSSEQGPQIVSLQRLDRNGFSETISHGERLALHQKTDFLAPQPYEKILRVFRRDAEGRTLSRLTSYHPSGQVKQYLEVVDGRAHGLYREWHANGQMKAEMCVIEGIADLSPQALSSWMFDGLARVWDESGYLLSQIPYRKGMLEGEQLLFHPTGSVKQRIPYHNDLLEGREELLDEKGNLLAFRLYQNGQPHGESASYWSDGSPQATEWYEDGKLLRAHYKNASGQLLAQVVEGTGRQALFDEKRLICYREIQSGEPCGLVEEIDELGIATRLYHMIDGKMEGEEILYFPSSTQPKLLLNWAEDAIQGVVRSWYPTGQLEAEIEMVRSQKHGCAFAWYRSGDLMLVEKYEDGVLQEGSYYAPNSSSAISQIIDGSGIATLYDSSGRFLRKVPYEGGQPLRNASSP